MQIATAEDVAEIKAELRAMREQLNQIAPPPQWVSVAEYMAAKGISKGTVYRWIASGQVEARGAGKGREVRL